MSEQQIVEKATLVKKLETHRFKPSEESLKVLHTFGQELREFIQKHSELLGVTVYGSHVKGTARTETDPLGKSDVDAFLYVDAEQLVQVGHDEAESNGVSDTSSEVWLAVNERIAKPFGEIFAKAAQLDQESLKDIRVRLVSKGRIDADITAMLQYVNNQQDGEDDLFGENSEEMPLTDLAGLFFLQLGKGLDGTRAYVLHKLLQLGSKGDEIWERLFYKQELAKDNAKIVKGIDAVADLESKRYSLFPHTVEDALKYYHLSNVTPKYEID